MLEITLWRMIRELLEIPGEHVAELMHCTKQTVSNIESGRSSTGMSLHLYVTTMQLLIHRNPEKVEKLKVRLGMITDFLGEA